MPDGFNKKVLINGVEYTITEIKVSTPKWHTKEALIEALTVEISTRLMAITNAAKELQEIRDHMETWAGFKFWCEVKDIDCEAGIAALWLRKTWNKNWPKIVAHLPKIMSRASIDTLVATLPEVIPASHHYLKHFYKYLATEEEKSWAK